MNRLIAPERDEEDLITLLSSEPSDVPEDCHRHCQHWDTLGECCECGDVRTPNHNFIFEQGIYDQ